MTNEIKINPTLTIFVRNYRSGDNKLIQKQHSFPLWHLPSHIYMFLWPTCLGSIPFRLLQFCFLFSGSACQKSFVEAPVFCAVHTHVSECWGSLYHQQTVPWTDAVRPLERWWCYLCDLIRTCMTSFWSLTLEVLKYVRINYGDQRGFF